MEPRPPDTSNRTSARQAGRQKTRRDRTAGEGASQAQSGLELPDYSSRPVTTPGRPVSDGERVMPQYRSHTSTHGRNMAGARSLWRATGMKDGDFGKPIIAVVHSGMLYSLPSRDLIADSVEYMVNAHCADAMVCISNCDKITPGMLMAAMR